MIKPTIHLNGSDPARLAEGYKEAFVALSDAIDKMCQVRPNDRDYYPQGPDAGPKARAEFNALIRLVEEARDGIEDLHNFCTQTVRERRKARR